MARLLVRTKAGFKGDISTVKPNSHMFGAMEDIVEHKKKYGNTNKWSGNFVIVDIPDMLLEEAQLLREPVVTRIDGNIDEITGKPKDVWTIHYNSKGNIDYEAMADTPEKVTILNKDSKVTATKLESQSKIIERTA